MKRLLRAFKKLLYSECPKCRQKAVTLDREELSNTTWTTVYKCKSCGEEFI